MTHQLQLSKLDLLRKEKEALKQQCALKEQKLSEDFQYLNDHAGEIVVNTLYTAIQGKVASILSSSKMGQKDNSSAQASQSTIQGQYSNLLFDLIKQNLSLSLALKLARPFITAFFIKRLKRMFKR